MQSLAAFATGAGFERMAGVGSGVFFGVVGEGFIWLHSVFIVFSLAFHRASLGFYWGFH